ncbi:MAG TPA: O-antigen ligase family protein [Pyrinomonadaceae bacterium]|nr:O-antigen ligase family protein [Pyrinomonadaceae bacterium]
MQNLLNRLDNLGGIETENSFAKWLERIAFIFLILMVLSAPHSIAATQITWLSGMFAWTIRLFIKPRPKLVRTPLDFALWAFFGWSVISAIFSYAPGISIDKLRNVALFLIFYFVINNLRNILAVKFLAFALIFSCLASAAWSPIERAIGRGVQISGVSAESLFEKGLHLDHDTYLRAKGENLSSLDKAPAMENKTVRLIKDDAIVEANGRRINTLDELTAEIEKNEITYLECFRPPDYFTVKVRRADLLDGANSLEKLGIVGWTRSRNWRYAGFYGHIITYAEVLQLIASLVLGLFIAGVGRKEEKEKKKKEDLRNGRAHFASSCRASASLFLLFCLITMIFALLMTFTRSAQIAFVISAFSIALANGSRKMLLGLAAVILPILLIGFFFMQQSRNVGFVDKKDDSMSYRQTVYREGFELWTSSPRNFFLGVGMDSVKCYKEEWHLFDNGRLETSHFHSTPLQLLVERGLPALLLWLWALWIYARILLKNSKFKTQNSKSEEGIIIGCFGGLVGFFVSSFINYSLGDGEVAMVFFLLMGLSVSLVIQNSKSDWTI